MMLSSLRRCMSGLAAVVLIVIIGACSNQESMADATTEETNSALTPQLTVYRSPTCGCCSGWVEHMENAGFPVRSHLRQELNPIKQRYGIEPQYQSCHTAVTDDFFFEGHIPAHVIQRFLSEQPKDARGLSVPGMPVGSPGMEMGNQRQAYDVLIHKKDGSTAVYQHIDS